MRRVVPAIVFCVACVHLAACGTDAATDDVDPSVDVGADTADVGGSADTDVADADDTSPDAVADVVPDGSDPDVAEPDVAEPDVAEPDVDVPDIGDPGLDADPDAELDVADSGDPDVALPDVGPDAGVDADAGVSPGDGAIPIDWVPEDAPEDSVTFSRGVQAGAMRATSALLWTRAVDAPRVIVRVWRPSLEDGEVLLVVDEPVEPDVDGFTHHPIEGLLPDTEYHYLFARTDEAGRIIERSAIGRFRTALAPGDTRPILVGATSCTNQNRMPFEAISMTAEEPLDVFLHIGDQTYQDSARGLDGEGSYREFWARSLRDPGFLALYQSVGHYLTWDDHEVTNNWDPERIDSERRDIAFRTFFETFAIERGPSGGLWNSFQWGDTAEFIVLDCRSERIDGNYISREQMDWFKDRLLNSTAHFKVVLNSVPITDMPLAYVDDGDRWESYDEQRDEVIGHIVDNDIRNVWFISGDFHIGFVSHVDPDGAGRRIREIAAGPGGNSNPVPGFVRDLLFGDQFAFHTPGGSDEVMTTLEFDPERDAVRVRFVDGLTGDVWFDEWVSERD